MDILKKIYTLMIISSFIGLIFSPFVFATNTTNYKENEEENWAVIICGSINKSKETNDLDIVFRQTAKKAYDTFKNLGYDDEHIYFLQGVNSSKDQSNEEGIDGFSNKTNAKYAINDWLATNSDENDNCFIFLIDHGNYVINWGGSVFCIYDNTSNKSENIRGSELAEWLDEINCNICTVMIEACHSGGFIKYLSKQDRIIITGTKLEFGTISLNNCFSSFVFDKLSEHKSYGEAWQYAENKMLRIKISDFSEEISLLTRILAKIGFLIMNPQLDDNGDGRGIGRRFISDTLPKRGDGNLALDTYP